MRNEWSFYIDNTCIISVYKQEEEDQWLAKIPDDANDVISKCKIHIQISSYLWMKPTIIKTTMNRHWIDHNLFMYRDTGVNYYTTRDTVEFDYRPYFENWLWVDITEKRKQE